MRALGAVLLLVLAACTPTTSASVSPSPSPLQTGSPASSPSPSPPPAIAFRCRLPVLWFASDPRVDGKTGFVAFPAGSLTTGTAALPTPAPLTLSFTYDGAVGRWLPVARAAVARDGLHYATATYEPPPAGSKDAIGSSGSIKVIDARTGAARVVYYGAPTFAVVDYRDAATLFLARYSAALGGTGRSGLYVVDPAGGKPVLVKGSDVRLDSGGWRVLNGGGAWGTQFSGGDAQWSGNQLVRLDLATGVVTLWAQVATDHSLAILGFYGDGLVLLSSSLSVYDSGQSSDTSLYVVTGAGHQTPVFETDGLGPSQNGITDSHGVWMGGSGAVWLYQKDNGFLRVGFLDDPTQVVQVGGGCIFQAG